MANRLILCDCLGSQTIDAETIGKASGLKCSRVHTALCTREAETAAKYIAEGDTIIACAQEAARFEEIADSLDRPAPACIDIRDRAGWSDDADTAPKMAALLAEGMIAPPAAKSMDVTSEGLCLVIGASGVADAAAERLADTLAVTVLLTDEADLPLSRAYEVIRGQLRRAEGTLGAFRLSFDGLQTVEPGGRGEFTLAPPQDGAETQCDLILDLSGETPLFPAHHKRDGYLRADPGDPNAVAAAVFEAAQMVGTFEKPFHVVLEEHLCAHSRAGKTGCTRCLDACPTGAIRPDGDHVAVDPRVCAGCGACSSLCPSGAISYDAPPVSHDLRRMQRMAETYRTAGGTAPRLLVHDDVHGNEMISLAARFGRGLPGDVIPLSVAALAGFGHSEMLAALALGFASVSILPAPRTEREPITREIALAEAMAGPDAGDDPGTRRIALLDIGDPEALSDHLYSQTRIAAGVTPILPMGGRRQVARLSAQALNPGAQEPIPLPEGAPYGAVHVNTDSCTLCLACASLCPSGALMDNPDLPQLRFQEDACLQCGICATVCPENAITLEPRFNPADSALSQEVLNEEEPFACIECGALFGVRSTVERMMDKLAGKHSMFQGGDAARLIQMCDDCRVQSQFHSADNPFAMGEKPRLRTTEDYLSKRRDH
ncbi:4Fe-4S binding protein [Alkalilacustris brevis]|uniref:4Fe-4S binding protein n=1 Tax=Alkalilacustris brevis TaxID=2026338 RepID=UPI000E0CE399|nr:4Fe-4S binding protein [Alkalilacustris brevis]